MVPTLCGWIVLNDLTLCSAIRFLYRKAGGVETHEIFASKIIDWYDVSFCPESYGKRTFLCGNCQPKLLLLSKLLPPSLRKQSRFIFFNGWECWKKWFSFIICVLWKIFSFIVSITYVTCTKILESDCVYAIIYLWPYDQLFHYEDLLFFSSRKYEEQVAFVWSVRVEFLIFKVWDSCFRASLWPYALYIRRWLLGRCVFQEHE